MRLSPLAIAGCIIGLVAALMSLVFGAWLPFRKSQAFIAAERNAAFVATVDDFKDNFDRAFDYYSPVGDEEITKFLAGNMFGIVASQEEEVARDLTAYIEARLFDDEMRHLLLAGQFRQSLWQRFGNDDDYRAAADYFERAQRIGPNLPPPLYALLGLYQARGDQENFERIGRMILERWPQDAKTRALFE